MKNDLIVAAKSHASILTEHLSRFGIKIKRTQALEVIANLHAQTDWNRFSAKLADAKPTQTDSSTITKGPLLTQFVLGRPGAGKTEVLKTVLTLEEKEAYSRPILICLSGSAHTYKNGLDRLLPKVSRWDVAYDEDGMTGSNFNNVHASAFLINFKPSVTGSRKGLRLAFEQFMAQFFDEVKHFKIGSLMIDEFSCLPPEDESLVLSSAAHFCGRLDRPVRQLLIASQVMALDALSVPGLDVRHIAESFSDHYNSSVPTTYVAARGQDWKAQSIDDPCLVTDIFIEIQDEIEACRSRHWVNERTNRLSYIKGNALWFRDFRNSLI